MAKGTKTKHTQKEQDDLLRTFYDDIIKGNDTPSIDHQKKFLLQLLNTKIAMMDKKTRQKKFLHFTLRISVMALSGIITVLLGFKMRNGSGLPFPFSNITLIISAVITFLSTLAVFWDIENYWVRNKIMLNKLKEIRYEYVFFLSGATDIKVKDLRPYLDKFLASLGDEYWEKFLKDVGQSSPDPSK
jgi:hypothetical protein